MHFPQIRLFDGGRVPNARRVRIFLAEKGITLTLVPVDIGKMEHRAESFRAINPLMRVPAIQFEDGSTLSESVAICRYFEEIQPDPPLFGIGARQRAEVEMWNRRAELEFYAAAQAVFRHLHPAMAGYEVPQIAAWGEVNRARALAAMHLLDVQLANHPYLAGEIFSIADITALVTVDFLKPACGAGGMRPSPALVRAMRGKAKRGSVTMRRPLLSILAALLATGAAASEKLTGEEIRKLFTGNTIAGFYVSGGFFSEYHAPDGRALGDNGFQINIDACWNVEGDNVCYHYGKPPDRRAHCFTVEKQGDALSLRVAGTGRLNGAASIVSGNPSGHNDGGRQWSCDDLLARGGNGRKFGMRLPVIPVAIQP
jgi:glutathione S-transferase